MEKENKAYKAHVLVLPFPAQGHVNPMLQLSKRLVARGVKATLANSVYISRTSTRSFDLTTSSIDMVTISDGYDDTGLAGAESSEAYVEKFKVEGSRTLADLIKRLHETGQPVHALVYDGLMPWALDVAKQFGLVGALFFTQTCAVNSIYYHVKKGVVQLPLEPATVVSLPGLPPLEPRETPSFVYVYGSYPGFHHMVVNQFSNIEKADWVLLNIFHKMEEELVAWMETLWRRVRTIGPTIPSVFLDKQLQDDSEYGINLFRPDSSKCLNWLNSKPNGSVIYVSFGSMADLDCEQTEEIAWGLKETSYNFLWVVRASEVVKLPEKFLDSTPEQKGLVVNWSPQLEVLAHGSMGCFVTHCGFNSVLEALSLGVAMVAMPQWTDQPTNAKFVEDVWGVGIRAARDERGIVRREMLADCVREVMEGEKAMEIKNNVIKWKNFAKEAVDKGGSSDLNIDHFAVELARSFS